MKKLFLMLSAFVCSISLLGKAKADECEYKYATEMHNGYNHHGDEWTATTNRPDEVDYYKYETCHDSDGNETSKTKYKCSGESCNLQWIKDSTKDWQDNTKYKYYRCDGDNCELTGTSGSLTGTYYEYDVDDKYYYSDNLHTCSNGTCYTKYSNNYFYDKSGNVSGGYSDTCGTNDCYINDSNRTNCSNFSCSGGNCYCDNDPSKVVSVPSEKQTIAPAFAYYANDNSDFNLCPDNSSSCYMNDNNQLVTTCKSSYLEKEGNCVASSTGCGAGYKQIENWCNRIRYTPAEAAQVLRDDNTNEVTITFRK